MVDDSALFHANPNYDPTKAREYYLRTRHLKGRKKGVGVVPPGSKTGSAKPAASPHHKGRLSPAQKRKQRQEAQARVVALNAKLDRLHAVLETLVKQAKRRAGADPQPAKKTTSPAQKQKDAKGSSPLTAQQKRDAAKRAKKSYEKNKPDPSPQQEVHQLQGEVKQVQEKIQKMRDELKASVAKARQQAAHPNSSKPKTEPATGRRH